MLQKPARDRPHKKHHAARWLFRRRGVVSSNQRWRTRKLFQPSLTWIRPWRKVELVMMKIRREALVLLASSNWDNSTFPWLVFFPETQLNQGRPSHDHEIVDLSSFLFNLSPAAALSKNIGENTSEWSKLNEEPYPILGTVMARNCHTVPIWPMIYSSRISLYIVAERRRRATELACVHSTALSPLLALRSPDRSHAPLSPCFWLGF